MAKLSTIIDILGSNPNMRGSFIWKEYCGAPFTPREFCNELIAGCLVYPSSTLYLINDFI